MYKIELLDSDFRVVLYAHFDPEKGESYFYHANFPIQILFNELRIEKLPDKQDNKKER